MIVTVEFASFSKCSECHARVILVLCDEGTMPIAVLCPVCDGPEVDSIVARLAVS